jgi:hypothetical protein
MWRESVIQSGPARGSSAPRLKCRNSQPNARRWWRRVFLSRFSLSLSLCVCRGSAIWLWMDFLSLSLTNGPPSFKSVSFPSLSPSLLFHTRYSARYKSSTQRKQRTHTRLLHRGVICCGREPIGIRRTLSHLEPSDTAGPRPLSRTFFRQYIHTNAQKVYIGCCWPITDVGGATGRKSSFRHTHTQYKQREKEREWVVLGRCWCACTQGRNRERVSNWIPNPWRDARLFRTREKSQPTYFSFFFDRKI